MRSLSALELLQVWEWGLNLQSAQRALRLLATACPGIPPDILATLSIGQRDVCLLTLREWVFGSHLVSVATCPHCDDRLDLTLKVADLRVEALPAIVASRGLPSKPLTPEIFTVALDDYEVQFRLPNSLDLAAIAQAQATDAQQLLLNRCILTVCSLSATQGGEIQGSETQSGEAQCPDPLPQPIRDALVQRMAEVDPQADMQLLMRCPACDHQWQLTFDILSFFWSEINAWASRIFDEVHTLAAAYGWREADILGLSPHRRQIYLELVRGNLRSRQVA